MAEVSTPGPSKTPFPPRVGLANHSLMAAATFSSGPSEGRSPGRSSSGSSVPRRPLTPPPRPGHCHSLGRVVSGPGFVLRKGLGSWLVQQACACKQLFSFVHDAPQSAQKQVCRWRSFLADFGCKVAPPKNLLKMHLTAVPVGGAGYGLKQIPYRVMEGLFWILEGISISKS